jgi:hypothetical protein
MKTRLWWAMTLVLTLLFGGQLVANQLRPAPTLHASWAFQPKNMREARDKAQSIVLAEVVAVAPGDDIVTAAPGESNNEDRIPTQKITMRVIKSYKGDAKAEQQLTLFQTGGTVVAPVEVAEGQKPPLGTLPQVILEGDPLYQAGEQYLLMLESTDKGMLRTIAPEGRYRIGNGGSLEAMVDNDVTKEAKGQSLANIEKTLLVAK